MRRRERNLHEVRVLELAVSGEVVNDGNFSGRFGLGLGLGPNLGSLRTCFSLCPFLGDLKLRRYSSPGAGTHRHFSLLCKERVMRMRKNKEVLLRWILKSEGIVFLRVGGRERIQNGDAKDNSYQTRNGCL